MLRLQTQRRKSTVAIKPIKFLFLFFFCYVGINCFTAYRNAAQAAINRVQAKSRRIKISGSFSGKEDSIPFGGNILRFADMVFSVLVIG